MYPEIALSVLIFFQEALGIDRFYVDVFLKASNQTRTIWSLNNNWSYGKINSWQNGRVYIDEGDKVKNIN